MRQQLIFKGLRNAANVLLRNVFFSSMEVEGLENLPDDGTPVLLVGNHQNGLFDPLSVVCTLTDRKVNVFTRGGVFSKGGWVSRRAEDMGMIPAYRLDREGLDMVAKNNEVMQKAGEKLMDGATLLIYPEGTHSERCHMADFSSAYLRMAFKAAAEHHFEKEVYVVPVGIHYSSYYGLRNRSLLRFGEPVRLSHWYGKYQEKPRTTCKEVNQLVRNALTDLVLDINDERYTSREALCVSRENRQPLHSKIMDTPRPLSTLLAEDQKMMHNLETMGDTYQRQVLTEVERYHSKLQSYDTSDAAVCEGFHPISDLIHILLSLLLLPFGVLSLWPGIVAWWLSRHLAKKSGSPCFANLYLISLGAFVVMPLLVLATGLAIGLAAGWTAALTWMAVTPISSLFAWYYWKDMEYIHCRINYMILEKEEKRELSQLHQRMEAIREELGYENDSSYINITKPAL